MRTGSESEGSTIFYVFAINHSPRQNIHKTCRVNVNKYIPNPPFIVSCMLDLKADVKHIVGINTVFNFDFISLFNQI